MKRTEFKYIVKEFQENTLPNVINRELTLPETQKIVSLVGARRSGKTYCFFQLIKDLQRKGIPFDRIIFVDFEDNRLLPLAPGDLNDLLEGYYEMYPDNKSVAKYFFLDEVQNAPDWEVFVRRVAENENGRVYVTGSSSKLLSHEIATALRGRTLVSHLYPLSFREFLLFKDISLTKDYAFSKIRYKIKQLLEEFLEFGGFPEVVQTPNLKKEILANYFDLVIYKDIIDRFSIRNISLLKGLTKYLITNIASLFSINAYYRALQKEGRASKETVTEYLSFLVDINLIYLVPIFSFSLKVQQVNPSKAYCIDSGLRNAVAFKFSLDEGRLAKNAVFIELQRRGFEIFYWKGKNEVDFVTRDSASHLTAINVTLADTVSPREIDGLVEFQERFPEPTNQLLLLTRDSTGEERGIKSIPLWQWLLER